ncbi:hypothetical protein Hanom_Chr17g01582901 [Helianthus anomalus]
MPKISPITSRDIRGVANFIINRRTPGHPNFNRGQQAVYDNVSAAIGEGREYEEMRRNWEQEHQTQLQSRWDIEDAHRVKVEKYWEEQQLFQAQQQSQWELMEQQRVQEVARRRAWEEEQERL